MVKNFIKNATKSQNKEQNSEMKSEIKSIMPLRKETPAPKLPIPEKKIVSEKLPERSHTNSLTEFLTQKKRKKRGI